MRITESQLRRIIRQEVRALHEAQDMSPKDMAISVAAAYETSLHSGTGVKEIAEDFKKKIDDLVNSEDKMYTIQGLFATVVGIMETQLRQDVIAEEMIDWFSANHPKYTEYL